MPLASAPRARHRPTPPSLVRIMTSTPAVAKRGARLLLEVPADGEHGVMAARARSSTVETDAGQASDRDRLADVRGVVAERRAAQLIAAAPSEPGIGRPFAPVAERTRGRGAPDVRIADDVLPRLSGQPSDDLAGPDADGRAVGAHRLDVGAARQLRDLAVGHPGADDAPREIHPAHPFLVEDLVVPGDDQVHRDVLGPRHVPEQPHERVQSRARTRPHLLVAEPREDSLRGGRAPADVHRVYGGVLPQKEFDEVHDSLPQLLKSGLTARTLLGAARRRMESRVRSRWRLLRTGR